MGEPERRRKVVAKNRKAHHDYEILERIEAGLVLTGSEVKSLRAGNANIAEAYVRFQGHQAWLVSAHISPYPEAGPFHNHEPRRDRKLLLHRRELQKWSKRVQERGLTAVPLTLFFDGAWAKLEVGLARGRKLHDKRHKLKEREDRREADRSMRRR